MNDQPLLREAVRALRAVEAEHDLAESTEQRVLSTLRTRARRGRAMRGLSCGIALSLGVAASAHAAVRGPAETWRVLTALLLPSAPVAPAQSFSPRAAREHVPKESAMSSAPEPAPPPSALETASAPAPAARPRKIRARADQAAPKGDPLVARAADPLPQRASNPDALYGAAHHLHFVAGDRYAALRAWEAYLAAAPEGTFAPEAHYNRALCLVALGRTEPARAALRAIAAGQIASYRARDAARLLRALTARAAP